MFIEHGTSSALFSPFLFLAALDKKLAVEQYLKKKIALLEQY